MFRLMKLKPPHGWSAVVWELGIVTLGVLIALGAQQFVDGLHWRSEMRDFRTALRAEISDDLATYTYRREQNRCMTARLDELQRWLDGWRAGRPLKDHGANRNADLARRPDHGLGQPRPRDGLAHAA